MQVGLLCEQYEGRLGLPKDAIEALSDEMPHDSLKKIIIIDLDGCFYQYKTAVPVYHEWTTLEGMLPIDILDEDRLYGASATALKDGRILVCSNYTDSSHRELIHQIHVAVVQPKAFIVDLSAELPEVEEDEFPTYQCEMINAYDARQYACRSHASLVTLSNGRVLRIGGLLKQIYQNDGIAEFDPRTKEWKLVLDTPVGADNMCVLLMDGRVLLSGGRFMSETAVSVCFLYDPQTRTYTPTGSMNRPRRRHKGCLLMDGNVFTTSGINMAGVDNSEIYNVDTGIWTIVEGAPILGTAESCILLPDGHIMVNKFAEHRSVIYDPVGNKVVGHVEMQKDFYTPLYIALS